MKQILFSILIGIMVTSIATQTALGDIYNTNRPWGTSTTLSELQDELDAINVDATSSIDVVGDQTGAAIFEPLGGGSAATTYIVTASWYYPDVDFGIYEFGTPSHMLELFDQGGVISPGDTVNIAFNQAANTVTVFDLSGTLAQTTYFKEFGFYVQGTDHAGQPIGPYYSEDNLNAYNDAHFLAYESEGDLINIGGVGEYNDINHWYIAAEADIATNRTATADFTDFVVLVESIIPVPVPAAVLLGILGLSVAGIKLRKYA